MANVGYVNKAVQAMYGIPYSQLTAEQKRILHEDSKRRAKLIEERQQAVIKNNLKAFADEAKMEKVLASIYRDCQKQILADVAETMAKVKKAGGTWSYANQSALTRSKGLFEQITKELTKLGQKEQIVFTQGLSNLYTDQFLRQVFELGQTMTVKANFNRLNPALIKKTLDYPWSGAMFSDRLWLDKETLGRNLRVGLTQSMILGEGIPEITDRIQRGIETSRYNAERIARTETKRVTYCAHNDAYEDMGVEELKYYTAGMKSVSKVCDTCNADNGKIFKRGEEPTLPRHPNCKCVYIPVVADTFKDNELNELTQSVRGAENYEKWREAEEAKRKAEEKKEKTPEDIARERIEEDKKAGKAYRDGVNAQISTKMKEHDDLPATYSDKIKQLQAEKAGYTDIVKAKQAELDKLYAEKDKIPEKRREISDLLDAGKITEDEYDARRASISEERRALSAKISNVEGELYDASRESERVTESIRKINREIADKQKVILQDVQALNTKIKESLDSELDYDLDILFVGNDNQSMMRLDHLEEFRSMRTALKKNTTFDYDTYKDELVKMAQRMDEDALIINSKLSDIVEKNWYNNYNGYRGAHYSPAFKRVNMKMDSNTHERALGNGLKGSWQAKYHEEGHQLDHLLAKVDEISGDSAYKWAFTHASTKTGKELVDAIEEDILSFINNAIEYTNKKNSTKYKVVTSLDRISADTRVAFDAYVCYLTSNGMDGKAKCQLGIFTDAIGLFTKDRLSRNMLSCGGWGHDSAYNKDGGKSGATSETWATFFALRTCGSEEEVEYVKNVMPSTWKCMDNVYKKLAKYLETNNLSY